MKKLEIVHIIIAWYSYRNQIDIDRLELYFYKMSDNKLLFFTAVIPPDPIKSEIWSLKNEISANFRTFKSLNSPPHITLIPPFECPECEEKTIIQELNDIAIALASFSVEIKDFGSFGNKVIYLKIVKNDTLCFLEKALSAKFPSVSEVAGKKARLYNPHITLAFRDLSEEMFRKVWNFYKSKSYYASFTVEKIYLLRHNGNQWDIRKEFSLDPGGM